jgi:hypothetical protein
MQTMSATVQDTATTTDTPDQGQQWEVWAEVIRPFAHTMQLGTLSAPPTAEDVERLFNEVRTVGDLNRGRDRDGLQIIAYEALCQVTVRDPEGRESRFPPPTGERYWRPIFGRSLLYSYIAAAMSGEVIVGRRRDRHRLSRWVFKEIALRPFSGFRY